MTLDAGPSYDPDDPDAILLFTWFHAFNGSESRVQEDLHQEIMIISIDKLLIGINTFQVVVEKDSRSSSATVDIEVFAASLGSLTVSLERLPVTLDQSLVLSATFENISQSAEAIQINGFVDEELTWTVWHANTHVQINETELNTILLTDIHQQNLVTKSNYLNSDSYVFKLTLNGGLYSEMSIDMAKPPFGGSFEVRFMILSKTSGMYLSARAF